jgi:hypothetical protein
MQLNQRFLADGESRYQTALREEIRVAVEAEYPERVETSTIWQRIKLHYEMKREIRRRLKHAVSPTSLYGRM